MIIDIHSHYGHPKVLPPRFFDGWAENIRAMSAGEVSTEHFELIRRAFSRASLDEGCDALVQQMDEAGIDKTVLHIIDFTFGMPEQFDTIEDVYAMHEEVNKRHPGRFVIFAGVDPNRDQAGVGLFENAIRERGFAGLKLYPPCGYSPSDRRLFPVYEVCQSLGVPVLTHVGPTSPELSFKHTRPDDLDEAARCFPKVNFIMAHAGIVHCEDAMCLAEYRPNVFMDLAGFQTEWRRGGLQNIVAEHKRRGLLGKLLFGTDWPIHRLWGQQKDWVNAMNQLGLSSRELELVMHENARRLLTRVS